MGEFVFKSLCVLVIAIVAFLAFKAGSFWGSNEEIIPLESSDSIHVPDQPNNAASDPEKQKKNYCSDVKITTIDFDVVGNDGEPGIKVWSNVVLPSGHHNYRINYFFYDENGRPIKDENGLYNIEEYVGGMGLLGEQDIPENQSRKLTYGFYLPYDELHVKKFGHIQLYVAARLVQDENNSLAETPAFGFVVIHSR